MRTLLDKLGHVAPTGIEPATLVQDMMELFREINNWSVLMPVQKDSEPENQRKGSPYRT